MQTKGFYRYLVDNRTTYAGLRISHANPFKLEMILHGGLAPQETKNRYKTKNRIVNSITKFSGDK